ncbi:MAG TPA: SGNH/GDSL hydrolase family protein [Syntrophorhabdaceae bacterium]|jgi:hypothetical protein
MVRLIGRHPRIALVLINVVLFVLVLGIIEILLRSFAPFNIATIGHRSSENADKYGWGFNPHERLAILDPDTGETFIDSANNHGWRDRDREYDNKNKAYRILVLGDSVTYGAIVPAEKVYTRILEDELRQKGYNIEIINIAYGGWGTDQQLEALVNEGIKYKPNLIIVQFCTNDLTDNTVGANKKENRLENLGNRKPFYYELDENQVLHRKENPNYKRWEPKPPDQQIRTVIYHSEVYKRLYAVYLRYRHREVNNKYRITDNQLIHLQRVIGLSEDSSLYKFLHNHKDMNLSLEDLANAINSSEYSNSRNTIYRILEDRWFHAYWSLDKFVPRHADPESYEFRLYFALIGEIRKHAKLIDADVVIFPETEEGHYQWSLSWHRIRDDERSRINYLSHIQVIKSAMKEMGVDVIDNITPYQRARNDPHPNIEGNQSMASDISRYLMLRKKGLETGEFNFKVHHLKPDDRLHKVSGS